MTPDIFCSLSQILLKVSKIAKILRKKTPFYMNYVSSDVVDSGLFLYLDSFNGACMKLIIGKHFITTFTITMSTVLIPNMTSFFGYNVISLFMA